jgi:hypothetical protein
MMPSMDPDSADNSTVGLLADWVQAVCEAPTALSEDLASVLGVDLARAETLGSQRIFPPPPGTTHLEFILGHDDAAVAFIDVTPSEAVTVADLEESFGEGHEALPGPHEAAPTVIFDDVWPDGAARGCTVLARLTPGPQETTRDVATVTLYLQTVRI